MRVAANLVMEGVLAGSIHHISVRAPDLAVR